MPLVRPGNVTVAVIAGALRARQKAGLRLHHYLLEATSAAQDAVEAGAVGKVLIDITPAP
jgi:NADPH:quinone reductase